MAVVGQPEAGKRVRAARLYAGFSKPEKLAQAIGTGRTGLNRTTLYAIENGRKPLQRPAALAIAEACRLPVAFFEVDFSRLPELVPDPGAAFERELEEAVEPSSPQVRNSDEGDRLRPAGGREQ